MSIINNFKTRSIKSKIKLEEAKLNLKMIDMVESMPSFAKDPDEKYWTVIESLGYGEYDEVQIESIRKRAQKIFYKSPLARGVITTLINFVIGRSFKIVPDDTDEKIIEYWDQFWEDNKMDMRVKELVKRTFRDGETFLRFFDMPKKTPPSVRFIRPSQISDKDNNHSFGIETDPDDVEKVIKYYREYNDSNNQLTSEIIKADEMIHTKIMVDSDVKRGISFLIGIIKYIKDYADFLDDRKHLNKIRTIFNLIGKPTGAGTAGNFANDWEDSNVKSSSGGSQTFNKKLPKSGSVLMTKGVEWEFKNIDLKAGDSKHDGRAMLLMIVAGSNLAEYMVTGDGSNANYASTMVTESPAVRTFEAWQDFFSHTFKAIYKKVIMDAVKDGSVPKSYEQTTKEWDPIKKDYKEIKKTITVTGKCTLEYPILIHRDIEKETKSFGLQNEMKVISKKTISAKLGYDYEEEQKQLLQEAQEEEIFEFDNDDEHNKKGDEE